MNNLRVALAQMNSQDSLDANLAVIGRLARSAKSKGAEVLLLPENALVMGLAGGAKALTGKALTAKSPAFLTLQEIARKNGLFLIVGSVPWRSPKPNRVFNRLLVLNPKGRLIQHYDKIHLFDSVLSDRVYRESSLVVAGEKVAWTKIQGWTFGFSICYDLRFPELYRALSRKGAQVLVVPAAFAVPTGRVHWDALTRARAIENQAYVLCPAQTGSHPGGRKTHGHTRIVDPWGTVLKEKNSGAGLIFLDLLASELKVNHDRLPVLKHRRDHHHIF